MCMRDYRVPTSPTKRTKRPQDPCAYEYVNSYAHFFLSEYIGTSPFVIGQSRGAK